MIQINIDKKEKTITIQTDYEFTEFEIYKYCEKFHFNFKKNKYESMGCALFFSEFIGRKYYPKKIKVENVNIELKTVQLSYS